MQQVKTLAREPPKEKDVSSKALKSAASRGIRKAVSDMTKKSKESRLKA